MQMIQAAIGYFYPGTKPIEPISIDAKRDQTLENTIALVATPHFNNPIGGQFVQNNLTPEQVKAAIKSEGKNWTTMSLSHIDDTVMELIPEYCTNLTALNIDFSVQQNPGVFSSYGLHLITTISKLSSLALNLSHQPRVGSGDILDLLNNSNIQSKITRLSITTALIGDAHLTVISKISNLAYLTIAGGFYTVQGVNQLLQSSSALESIYISGNQQLFDTVGLNALSVLPKISEVTLSGQWNINDHNVIDFLKAKPNLRVLGIAGYPISQNILKQVATMTSLAKLVLLSD